MVNQSSVATYINYTVGLTYYKRILEWKLRVETQGYTKGCGFILSWVILNACAHSCETRMSCPSWKVYRRTPWHGDDTLCWWGYKGSPCLLSSILYWKLSAPPWASTHMCLMLCHFCTWDCYNLFYACSILWQSLLYTQHKSQHQYQMSL